MTLGNQPSPRSDVVPLLTRGWQSALILAQTPLHLQAAWLSSLLAEGVAAAPADQQLIVEDCLQHLELFAPESRSLLIDAHLLSRSKFTDDCGCGPTPDEERDRLARRVALADSHVPTDHDPTFSLAAKDAARPLIVIVVPDFLTAGTFLQPPIDALLAASRLQRSGFNCKVLDNRVLRLDADELSAEASKASLIAVITTPYDHIQNYFIDYRLRHALLTADALKSRSPAVPLAICGAHGTVRPDIILRDCAADYVVRGEMDTALAELVMALRENKPPAPAIIRRGDSLGPIGPEGAVGAFKLVDLEVRFRSKRVAPDDIRPAYDLVDLEAYHGDFYEGVRATRKQRWATVLASRGCAYDCNFCFNFWGRRTRRRPAEEVAEELAWLEHEQKVSAVFFIDFNFTESRAWIEAFCAHVGRLGLRIPWLAQTRCDLVDVDMLYRMRGAGCHGLWFGVESFDADIARGLRKYRDVDAAAIALAACAKVHIKPHIFVMIGVPGETRQSINTTIRHMHRWKAAYCGVMPTVPRFGTALYADAKRQFPTLGQDFYSLRAVRGLVGNALDPEDLQQAMKILNDRRFIDASEPAQISI